MPARKKNKNKTGTDPSDPTGSLMVSAAAYEMEYGTRETPFLSPAEPGRKPASVPKQLTAEQLDAEFILTYLACCRLLEQALVRAGFAGASSRNKQPRPDWYRWARHIEKKFDPRSSEELQMSVAYLLALREGMDELPGRMQNRIQWESASPFSDILWLTEILQQTSLQLMHRYNFGEAPGCDTGRVMAALLVVEEWRQLVPG